MAFANGVNLVRDTLRRIQGNGAEISDAAPRFELSSASAMSSRADLRDRGDVLVLEQLVRVITSDDLALLVVLSTARARGQDGRWRRSRRQARRPPHRRPLINHGGGRLKHRRESLLVKQGHDLGDLDVLGAVGARVLRLRARRDGS